MRVRRVPVVLFATLLATRATAQLATEIGAALDGAVATAEEHLKAGDRAAAERLYREALFHGWLLQATLERLEGRLQEARTALDRAALFRIERTDALQSLALAELQAGRADRAGHGGPASGVPSPSARFDEFGQMYRSSTTTRSTIRSVPTIPLG